MKTIFVAIQTLVKNLRKDDILHFFCCFFICLILGLLITPPIAVIMAVGGGICKEWYDYKHPDKHTYSRRDIFFDFAGAVIAFIIVCFIKFA